MPTCPASGYVGINAGVSWHLHSIVGLFSRVYKLYISMAETSFYKQNRYSGGNTGILKNCYKILN